MDEPDLLTPAEVGRLFRVQTRSVQKWVRDGRLKAIRTPSGTIRIYRSSIQALLDEAEDV